MLEKQLKEERQKNRTEHRDFRLYLQQELVKRCQSNPKYSLRAFAKFLAIESSHLSKILRGKRPVGQKLISKFAQRLGLKPGETENFSTEAGKESAPHYHRLTLDAFESIEDWRHYAVLELMKLRTFRPDIKWIAQVLNITATEARAYVERLERIQLLRVDESGKWTDSTDGFSTHILSENESSYAHRRAQKRILEKAIEALEETPIERRDQSSMMMATSAAKITEAKKRVTKFRHELCDFLEDVKVKDSIYQLSLSLFPLVDENHSNIKKKR